MDHFALPDDTLFRAERAGKLHRNFMGYTHQHTLLLIGLGVSSISDAGSAFSQNVKVVEDYLRLINENKLPVFKGHLLTVDDAIISKHILNIMCKGYTNWDLDTSPCVSSAESMEKLKLLADDGLIELHSKGLVVTQKGKRFLRNICMALDARLAQAKPIDQLFSMSI